MMLVNLTILLMRAVIAHLPQLRRRGDAEEVEQVDLEKEFIRLLLLQVWN